MLVNKDTIDMEHCALRIRQSYSYKSYSKAKPSKRCLNQSNIKNQVRRRQSHTHCRHNNPLGPYFQLERIKKIDQREQCQWQAWVFGGRTSYLEGFVMSRFNQGDFF